MVGLPFVLPVQNVLYYPPGNLLLLITQSDLGLDHLVALDQQLDSRRLLHRLQLRQTQSTAMMSHMAVQRQPPLLDRHAAVNGEDLEGGEGG